MMTTFMPPPSAATFLAIHPRDNKIFAIGMEDSSILIYDFQADVVRPVFFVLKVNLVIIYDKVLDIDCFPFSGRGKSKRTSEKNYRPRLL